MYLPCRCLIGLAFWAFTVVNPVGAALENWPQFRGPSGQGLSNESGLPLSWGDSKNVRWKTPLPFSMAR